MEKYVTPMRAKRLIRVLLAGLLFIAGVLGLFHNLWKLTGTYSAGSEAWNPEIRRKPADAFDSVSGSGITVFGQ